MHSSFLNNREEVFHTPTREKKSCCANALQSAYPVWSKYSFNNASRNHQEISDTNISVQVRRQLWVAQNIWTLRICQNMIRERKAKALAQKDNPVSDK